MTEKDVAWETASGPNGAMQGRREARPPVAFGAPGPGSWQFDADHQCEPRGRLVQEWFEEPFRRGFANLFERYGAPLLYLETRHVNGWAYSRAKAVGAPDRAGAPPPNLVLKVLTRLHPELRRRNRTAARALRQRLWIDDAMQWESERPDWLSRSHAALEVELDSLDDHDLLRALDDAWELAQAMLQRHFELLGPAVAAGRLLAACEDWGCDRATVNQLFGGASPASAATSVALDRIRARFADGAMLPQSMAELWAAAPAEVDAFMAEFGWRVIGDAPSEPALAELPDRLLQLVNNGRSRFDPEQGFEVARETVRVQIPAAEVDRFDELLRDVRETYWTLDDNAGVTTLVAGALRRVLLQVAERAIQSGQLAEADDIWLLELREAQKLLGRDPPVAEVELEARRSDLRAANGTPPSQLGGEPHPPPDPSVFPSAMAEIARSFDAFVQAKFGSREPSRPTDARAGSLVVDGVTVASGEAIGGRVTARIVVAQSPAEAIDAVEPGVILVCPSTTPAWNVLFPLLAGIVTETGSSHGHTAVMAREFGVAALVGIGPVDPDWDGHEATIVPPTA